MNPELVLTIRVTPDGKVSVNGPLDNPLLAYKLLGIAHQAIAEHQEQKQRLIQPVTLTPQRIP